jgi:integrase
MEHESYEKALKYFVSEVGETTASRISSKAMDFKRMLDEKGLEYTLENVSSILKLLLESEETKKSFFEHRKIQFKIARKVFDETEVREKLFLHSHNTALPTWTREVIEKTISLKPDMNIKLSSYIRCNLSLFFGQLLNYTPCDSLSDISMLLLRDFLRENGNYSPHYLFWRYYAHQQVRQYIFIEKMHDVRIAQNLLFSIDFTVDFMSFPREYSVEEFSIASRNIIIDMQNDGYSKHSIPEPQRAFNAFGLFLEANQLWYSKELVNVWALEMSKRFKIRMKTQECYLLLANTYMEGQMDVRLLRENSKEKQGFPEWFQKPVQGYLAERVQDGLEKRTLAMDRCCLMRLIKFLNLLNIKSFESITPEIVKEFNLQDMDHKTPEAKNAYNTRIRGFLRYLERTKIITSRLANALPCSAAISIRPVQILSAEEDDLLKNAMNARDGSRTILRDIAIVKLERFLGLRISDASSLRFQNIDIPHMEIHLVQKKTHKQLILPLPNTILNSIVRYIENERPDIESEYIFLTSRHPFKQLQSVSIPLLEHLFGERVHRKNHILRKTLATEMLCSEASVSIIADTLGHSSNDNVAKYLDTNDKAMQLCCLSLDGIEYTGELL